MRRIPARHHHDPAHRRTLAHLDFRPRDEEPMNLLGFAYELLWVSALFGIPALMVVLWEDARDRQNKKQWDRLIAKIEEYRRDFE
jgi:hypothetical protein